MKKPLFLLLAIASVALGLGLGGAVRAEDKAGDPVAGEKKAAMCIGCHNIPGYQASFPEVYKVPKIAGQNGKYIVSALAAYRKGERKHPTMRAIAGSLSDQDMADLARFYAQLGRAADADARRRRRAARQRRRPRSPSCSPPPTASRATAPTSPRRSIRLTRSSPASTPTTSTPRSRPTRSTTTRSSAAATRS